MIFCAGNTDRNTLGDTCMSCCREYNSPLTWPPRVAGSATPSQQFIMYEECCTPGQAAAFQQVCPRHYTYPGIPLIRLRRISPPSKGGFRPKGSFHGFLSAAFFLWLLLMFKLPVFAQPSGFAASFSRVGFGPRGMAVGNAMTGVMKDGIYAYYNPAFAAAALQGNQIDFSTSIMSFDRSLHKLNATFSLPPKAGITLSIINGNVGDIDGRTSSGYHTEQLSTHEYQLMSAFGIRISPKFFAGIGLKYNLADYHTGVENATSFGLDAGVVYIISERFRTGLAVRDLLAQYSWNSSELYGDDSSPKVDEFPVRIHWGASCDVANDLLFAADAGLVAHPSINAIYQFRLGARYRVHERVSLRGGWQVRDLKNIRTSNNLSAGFSIHLPFDRLSPSVDYAFVPEPNQISSMHVFGIKLNL